MRKFIFQIILFAFISMAMVISGPSYAEDEKPSYQRVISFLPSLTEIIYALGADDVLVGVTRFCRFPPEAQTKEKIGGIVDTNFEMVYSLKPDLLIISSSENEQKKMLEGMGFPMLPVETRTIPGVIESIRIIGKALDKEEKAEELAGNIERKMKEIEEKTRDLPKPRVLMTFLRPFGEGNIREVYIAGNHTFFNDLIEIMGAVNAYQGEQKITSPIVTQEGILQMDPDIIIEVMSNLRETRYTVEDVLKDWEALPDLKAYRNKRIYILDQPYIDIPGPRLDEILDILARITHPDVKWDKL